MIIQENRRGIIYQAKNIINSKCYIGKTVENLESRKWKHHSESNKIKPKYKFHRALKKYSKENFEWFIIGYIDNDIEHRLNEMEMFFIKKYDSKNNGYNMTDGGEGFWGFNPYANKTEKELKAWKRKLSESKKGKKCGSEHHQFHKKRTDEEKSKISNTLYETFKNPEIRKKMSDSRIGIKLSKKTKLRISKAKKGIPRSEETKEKCRIGAIERYKTQTHPMQGRNHSDKSRKKMSKSGRGKRIFSKNGRYKKEFKILEMIELKNEGFTNYKISRILGCSTGLVNRRFYELKVK